MYHIVYALECKEECSKLEGFISLVVRALMWKTRSPGTHSHVNRNDSKPNESQRIAPFGALGTITQREQKAHHKQAQVEVV